VYPANAPCTASCASCKQRMLSAAVAGVARTCQGSRVTGVRGGSRWVLALRALALRALASRARIGRSHWAPALGARIARWRWVGPGSSHRGRASSQVKSLRMGRVTADHVSRIDVLEAPAKWHTRPHHHRVDTEPDNPRDARAACAGVAGVGKIRTACGHAQPSSR
jgi:hypothetical protein